MKITIAMKIVIIIIIIILIARKMSLKTQAK
jgi:hypothetical protein